MALPDSTLTLLADAGKFLAGSVFGALVKQRVEGSPKLVSSYQHSSAFQAKTPEGQSFTIHTHEVVVRNAGRKPATNVRLSHLVLPQFNIFPSVPYTVEQLPDGSSDIVIPTLVPKQQVTVSYLYYPPLLFTGVNSGIRSDQGFAKPVELEISAKNSTTFNIFAASLFLLGCGTVFYWIWLGARRLSM